MFKLIRDNIPELMKQSGAVCNYAVAENDELYIALLHSKLVEELNEFLDTGNVIELVDLVTAVNALLTASGIAKEQFDAMYEEKLKNNGGFEKKLIGFFPDRMPEQQQKDVDK